MQVPPIIIGIIGYAPTIAPEKRGLIAKAKPNVELKRPNTSPCTLSSTKLETAAVNEGKISAAKKVIEQKRKYKIKTVLDMATEKMIIDIKIGA